MAKKRPPKPVAVAPVPVAAEAKERDKAILAFCQHDDTPDEREAGGEDISPKAARALIAEVGKCAYQESFAETHGALPVDDQGYPLTVLSDGTRVTLNPRCGSNEVNAPAPKAANGR